MAYSSRAAFLSLAAASCLSTGCFEDQAAEDEDDGSASSGVTSGTDTVDGMMTSSGSTASSTSTGVGSTEDSVADSSSGDTGSTTTGSADNVFVDDFNRPDSPELGNGWIEKSPDVFAISGDGVQGSTVAPALQLFHDHLVYRPEPWRDVRVSIEFTIDAPNPLNEPAVFVRGDEGSEILGERLVGYMAVAGAGEEFKQLPPTNPSLCIWRFDGEFGPGARWCEPLDLGPLAPGFVFRLTLDAQGIQPVLLQAVLERRDPVDPPDAWELWAEVSVVDEEVNVPAEEGLFGFGGGRGPVEVPLYAYDNFTATFY